VNAAVLISWTFVLLLVRVGCADALKALEPPRMLGVVVGTAPEMVWPLEERLSLPYTPSGDEAPACSPVSSRSSAEAGRVNVPEEEKHASRMAKHRQHGNRWRKGGQLAGEPSYSEVASRGARRSHARRGTGANSYHSRFPEPVERPRLTSREVRGKASSGKVRKVRADFYPHGPLTR
jgi:hypothetical protein